MKNKFENGIHLSFNECQKIMKMLKDVNVSKHDIAMPLYGKIIGYIKKLDKSLNNHK